MSYTVDSNKYLIYFKRIFLIVSKFRKKYADLTGVNINQIYAF